MDNFIRKRIDIATCWATNRISSMDTLERYEDSYAIAEEFREWILHIGEKKATYYVLHAWIILIKRSFELFNSKKKAFNGSFSKQA